MTPFGSTPAAPRLPGDDFNVPFEEAIAWARERKATLPAEFYGARLQAVRARSFTVSGLAALDQIQQVADAAAQATASGQTLREWRKTLAPEVLSLGKSRTELIFRNAVQTNYGIGRTIQQRQNAAARPHLMWDAINDGRTRPTHRAMDGHIAPIDDPIWKRWHPPAGHNCRCTRISLTQEQAQRRGLGTPAPDAQPDAGWEGDPSEGNDDLLRIVRARRDSCATTFAAGRAKTRMLSCDDGAAMEKLLQAASLLVRNGAFPALKLAPTLAAIEGAARFSQEALYQRFAEAVEQRIDKAAWTRDLGVEVGPDRSLFLRQDGSWKLGKRGRALWIDFLADTLVDPAEVRLADVAPNASRELFALGGYLCGGRPLHTLLVFRRVGQQWQGRSAYQIDSTGDLTRYRAQSMPVWLRK